MDYQLLKSAIAEVIKANGNNEITGALLQSVLLTMVDTLGEGYRFAGVASQAVVPQNSDALLFYVAEGEGVYPNFNGLTVDKGELAIFFKPTGYGAWVKQAAKIGDVGGYKLYSTTVYTYGNLPEIPTDGGMYYLYADRVGGGIKYRYIYTSSPDESSGAWTMFATVFRIRLATGESSAAGNVPIVNSETRVSNQITAAITELKLEYDAEGSFTEQDFVENSLTQESGDVQFLEELAQNGVGRSVSAKVGDYSNSVFYLMKRWWQSSTNWGFLFGDNSEGFTLYYNGTYHISGF